jgi:D-alanine-D-alanine ligase
MKKSKLTVGVIFGGRSAEHQVSLVTARSVMNALDPEKYNVVPIGITSEGKWLSTPDAVRLLQEGSDLSKIPESILTPDPTVRSLVSHRIAGEQSVHQQIDVVFPLVHGTYGEDGTLQGLLELADLPYVGAGVLGSSVGMDKVVTKRLCELAGIPTAPYRSFLASEYRAGKSKLIAEIEKVLGYPAFVKPANSGSSVGISKAHDRMELLSALELAMQYDRKILVERGVKNAREIELGVLGNDKPAASIPGEIVPSNEFYDYDAKYVDGKSTAYIPAKLPKAVVKKLQEFAICAFKAIDCAGMARVDFLVVKKTNKIFLNELNTIPGFTSISMYPKLWEASGVPYGKLLDRLIELALERHHEKSHRRTAYSPKEDWYKE